PIVANYPLTLPASAEGIRIAYQSTNLQQPELSLYRGDKRIWTRPLMGTSPGFVRLAVALPPDAFGGADEASFSLRLEAAARDGEGELRLTPIACIRSSFMWSAWTQGWYEAISGWLFFPLLFLPLLMYLGRGTVWRNLLLWPVLATALSG